MPLFKKNNSTADRCQPSRNVAPQLNQGTSILPNSEICHRSTAMRTTSSHTASTMHQETSLSEGATMHQSILMSTFSSTGDQHQVRDAADDAQDVEIPFFDETTSMVFLPKIHSTPLKRSNSENYSPSNEESGDSDFSLESVPMNQNDSSQCIVRDTSRNVLVGGNGEAPRDENVETTGNVKSSHKSFGQKFKQLFCCFKTVNNEREEQNTDIVHEMSQPSPEQEAAVAMYYGHYNNYAQIPNHSVRSLLWDHSDIFSDEDEAVRFRENNYFLSSIPSNRWSSVNYCPSPPLLVLSTFRPANSTAKPTPPERFSEPVFGRNTGCLTFSNSYDEEIPSLFPSKQKPLDALSLNLRFAKAQAILFEATNPENYGSKSSTLLEHPLQYDQRRRAIPIPVNRMNHGTNVMSMSQFQRGEHVARLQREIDDLQAYVEELKLRQKTAVCPYRI